MYNTLLDTFSPAFNASGLRGQALERLPRDADDLVRAAAVGLARADASSREESDTASEVTESARIP